MATVLWVGLAQAIPDYWTLAIGTPTIGNTYTFTAQTRTVSFKATTAVAADVAADPRVTTLTLDITVQRCPSGVCRYDPTRVQVTWRS